MNSSSDGGGGGGGDGGWLVGWFRSFEHHHSRCTHFSFHMQLVTFRS